VIRRVRSTGELQLLVPFPKRNSINRDDIAKAVMRDIAAYFALVSTDGSKPTIFATPAAAARNE